MEFGKTLREAREAKGYTIPQLAELTHIMSQVVEGLENENFKKIPAPIYGRGFVKLCCQALDLDPKPMIDEFMAIYSGEKPPAKPAPVVEKPVAPIAPVAPADTEQPSPSAPQQDLFGQPDNPQPAPAKTISRFAPPTPETSYTRPVIEMPAIPWRLVMLVIAAIAALWIVIAACRSVYRTLSSPTERPVAVEKVSESPRTPKAVKPLYID